MFCLFFSPIEKGGGKRVEINLSSGWCGNDFLWRRNIDLVKPKYVLLIWMIKMSICLQTHPIQWSDRDKIHRNSTQTSWVNRLSVVVGILLEKTFLPAKWNERENERKKNNIMRDMQTE